MGQSPNEQEVTRIVVLLFCMCFCFVGVLTFLWNLQVVTGHTFSSSIVRQSVRRVRLPELRGRMFDANGIVLADNRPSHCVGIYIEELRQARGTIDRVEELLKVLSERIGLPVEISRKGIQRHIRESLALPLLAWRDLDDVALARFAEQVDDLPGVAIYTEAVREYGMKDLACHTIGYVGRGGMADDDEEPYHYYLPQMEGKAGLERSMDGLLRGEAGGQSLRVDVLGYRHEVIGTRAPRNGDDLMLSLDVGIQRLAEGVLEKETGAVCVIDPSTGDVLALASYPGYDLNKWIPGISQKDFDLLNRDPRKPFQNRASGGRYAPGSTFKPLVALAALETGRATASTEFSCPGYIEFGGLRMHCGNRHGHGALDMRQALEKSCNVYFFHLGISTGWEYVAHMARATGFGSPTGVPLDSDAGGLVPDSAWKRRRFNEGWREGDTANGSIGQGFLLVSPLQMAMMTAAIANGGVLYAPRLVKGTRAYGEGAFRMRKPKVANRLSWRGEDVALVQEGMGDVIMADRGTGRLARVPGLDYAGKTGTAQFGPRGNKTYRAWMIAYAPAKNPRYAVSIVLDEAGSSGLSVAPKMKRLMAALFAGRGEGEG